MTLISLFTGAGGLDLGFKRVGFDTLWANEFDKNIWETFQSNFPDTELDKRSITDIPSDEIPDAFGLIGGPPCQSWSEAGKSRGIEDNRGQLFFEYIRVLKEKQPLFFLAENVSGMLASKHKDALDNIKSHLEEAGYTLSFKMLNAHDYGVPQDRKRIFFVGFRNDLGKKFEFPDEVEDKKFLSDAISDLTSSVLPAIDKTYTNGEDCKVPNHEYIVDGFSSMYMSRNRVRTWDEPSFTIQAGGRHAPLHPQAPTMEKIGKDKMQFVVGREDMYRRLSIRECARIQTFPDEHIFKYKNLTNGYKMVGNAVPPLLGEVLASAIKEQIFN